MEHVKSASRLKINPCKIVNHLRAFSIKFMATRRLQDDLECLTLWFVQPHPSERQKKWDQRGHLFLLSVLRWQHALNFQSIKKRSENVWRKTRKRSTPRILISSFRRLSTRPCENWCCQAKSFIDPADVLILLMNTRHSPFAVLTLAARYLTFVFLLLHIKPTFFLTKRFSTGRSLRIDALSPKSCKSFPFNNNKTIMRAIKLFFLKSQFSPSQAASAFRTILTSSYRCLIFCHNLFSSEMRSETLSLGSWLGVKWWYRRIADELLLFNFKRMWMIMRSVPDWQTILELQWESSKILPSWPNFTQPPSHSIHNFTFVSDFSVAKAMGGILHVHVLSICFERPGPIHLIHP